MPSNAISGLTGLAGINAISQPEDVAFATPEERMGGPVNPYHANTGEFAPPYSYNSLAVPAAASHGPYGPENQLLDDEYWFMEPAGMPQDNPQFDYNTPNLTRSHGSVHNTVNVNGVVPSLYDSVNLQMQQMPNHSSNLNTSKKMTENRLGDAQQDDWREIWIVDNGNADNPPIGKQYSHQAFGFGVNDAATNASRKINLYGYGDKHQHRRYAQGHIPGNFLWMRPKGRPLFKTMAGPARPPIGAQSQFAGQDIGFAFSYDTGAILQSQPTEYVPPPSPNITSQIATYDDPNGTDGFAMW